MKTLSTLVLTLTAMIISSCGDKNISATDIQEGIKHVTNITTGKNASDVIANVTHAANDVQIKLNASAAK